MIARKTMKHAEKNGLLRAMQYGGRNKRQYLDPTGMKRMTWDMCTIMRKNMIMMENDAKSCFNRIIIMIAIIRRLAVSETFVKMWGKIYWNMKYKMRTMYGILKE